jgi:hypothetical protein
VNRGAQEKALCGGVDSQARKQGRIQYHDQCAQAGDTDQNAEGVTFAQSFTGKHGQQCQHGGYAANGNRAARQQAFPATHAHELAKQQAEQDGHGHRCQHQNDRLPFYLPQLFHVHLQTQQCDADPEQAAGAEIDARTVADILRQIVERHPHQQRGENDGPAIMFLHKTGRQVKYAAQRDARQQRP